MWKVEPGKSDIERFPVVVSGPLSTNQLLGAPAPKSVTKEQQATAVKKLLVQWNIESKEELK
ncbi:hypothetical protein FOCC_FOCC011038 [Frankliniella occidentalis]|nr:hypothetical protein FOCC_FOCC011038 [Frankliniella occidentalis]